MVPRVTGNHQTVPAPQRRETGHVLPRPIPGCPPKKKAALLLGIPALLEAHPEASQREYCQWWEEEHGMQVSRTSMSRAIHALGPIALPEEEHALTRAVQKELLAVRKRLKHLLEWTRRGQFGPCSPIASQHDPWLQPGTNRPQGSWLGHLEPLVVSLADFFSASLHLPRDALYPEELLPQVTGKRLPLLDYERD